MTWKWTTDETPKLMRYLSDTDIDDIILRHRFCHRWDTDTDELPLLYLSRAIWISCLVKRLISMMTASVILRKATNGCMVVSFFETSVSGKWPEAPRSAESYQNQQTVAERCSFLDSFKSSCFWTVFGPVAVPISRKRAYGCNVVHILITTRPSQQGRDTFGQYAGKVLQNASG